MTIYISTVILLWQFAITTSPSLSASPFEVVDLGQSAILSCWGECSASCSWTMGSTQQNTVAHCNQTMCDSKEGFQMSHDMYLKGDLALNISSVDYSKRTWYTCVCNGQKIRRVYLRIKRVDYRRQIERGDSFTVDFFISERVKITFNKTGDDERPRSVTLYESSGNKVSYHPDYEKRAESKTSFILKDFQDTDSGVYTVWDADNQEIIASYTVTASPSPTFEVVDLGQSATLSCWGKCSASCSWMMGFTKQYTVAHCNQTMCDSKEGLQMSHDQYLKGDLTLSIGAVDYSKRTWYTCQCDGQKIRRVYLRIKRVDYRRQIECGDSFTVDFFISERVKITFNRTGDEERQRSITLYESSGDEVFYHPDYEKRAESRSNFILKDFQDTDSGVYTVWDADNQDIVASYTLTVTGKQVNIPENVKFTLYMCSVFFFGIILGFLGIPWILKEWDWIKKRKCCSEHEKSTVEENEDSAAKVPLKSVSSS